MIVLVVGGYTYYSSQNHIQIAEVEQTGFVMNKKLGQAFKKSNQIKYKL